MVDTHSLWPLKADELKSKVLSASTWLTFDDLSMLLNTDINNAISLVNAWIKDDALFVVEYNGTRLIPAYSVDEKGKPIPIIRSVLLVFKGRKSAWAIAAWFVSNNGWLGGISPIEAIDS